MPSIWSTFKEFSCSALSPTKNSSTAPFFPTIRPKLPGGCSRKSLLLGLGEVDG